MRKLLIQRALAPALAAVLAVGLALWAPATSPHSNAATFPNDDRAIAHVLNRIGFGPRPGDVRRVRELGLQRYVEQQLQPERIADTAVDARLAGLTTIRMSAAQIQTEFEQPLLEARRRRQLAAEKSTEPLLAPTQVRANQLMVELGEQKVIRAIYGERQLQEVLTDFWFNHFNVDARKGRDRFLLTTYEREAIRPHVLGKFRDLLEATAKSPAMLFYLDNWMSVDPDAVRPGPGGALRAGNRQKRGLNENYGRELMELHTLGVDGGYSQQDVIEVARAFTGWTIGNPRQGGGYFFNARLHDAGEKVVLGHRIKAGGGESDGEQVLGILATHPSTARFIATKLVRRFVGDIPPASLVDRAAARFLDSGGDIREVVRTIVTSPEFLRPDAYRAKVKSPFEFIVSAVRATGAEVDDATPLVRALQQLGMPLYACQPPAGYKDTADAWVNTGALVNRMNLALALASNRLRGITVDHADAGDGQQSPTDDRRFGELFNGEVSDTTLATMARATTPAQTLALALGSPEFQKR